MIKHIQSHIESCSLCRREKLQADKYQLQTTEIPNMPFAKLSIDLIVDLPISHNGNKNILVMIDHLTGWPMAEAIPNKEATTVANALFEKLILKHGPLVFYYQIMGLNFQMIPWPMSVMNLEFTITLLVPTHQDPMAKLRILINF